MLFWSFRVQTFPAVWTFPHYSLCTGLPFNRIRSTMSRKPGDWNCSSCQHLNFSWRESCQRCSDPKQGNDGGYSGRNEERRSDEGGDYGRRSSRTYGFGSSYSSGRGEGGGLERSDYSGSGGGFYDRNPIGRGDYRGSSEYSSTRGYGDRGDYRSNEYRESARGGYGGGSDMRPGDWNCVEKSCGAHNFASRTNCFKCGAPKDDNEEAMDGRGGGGYESGWSGGSYERGSSRGGSYYDSGNAGAAGGRAGWKSGDWMCTRYVD